MKITWIKAYGLFMALMAVLADQFSKHWVLEKFGTLGELLNRGRLEVLPFFDIVLVRNSGISFGLFSNSPHVGALFFSVLALAVCGVLLWVMLWRSDRDSSILSFGLIIGGAVGNIIDRLLFGAVIDFLDFHIGGYHWPAFNLADCFIFVGVAVLLITNFPSKKS